MDEAAKQRLRVKEESYKAYIEEELSTSKTVVKKFTKPDLGGIGQQVVLVLESWQTQGFENERWCWHVCYFKNEKRPLKAFV